MDVPANISSGHPPPEHFEFHRKLKAQIIQRIELYNIYTTRDQKLSDFSEQTEPEPLFFAHLFLPNRPYEIRNEHT